MSFNSGKTPKAGNKPPADKAERTASGRPSSLNEISHLGWREWDGHMVDLKGYFRDHFPDMSSICPDPMKATGPAPAYIVYKARSIPVGAFKDLDLTTSEGMAEKELRMAAYKDSINLVATKVEKTRIPTDVQQAFGYIKGLNSKVAVYEEYKNYLSNAMVTMKLDKYPVTMAEAIQGNHI